MTPGSDQDQNQDGLSDRPANDQERVRVCPECSEIVAFEERTCPACGHHDPLLEFPALGPGLRTCKDCGREMLHALLFCPGCGRERDAVVREHGRGGEPTGPEADNARADTYWAWSLALIGPLVLAAAVLSIWL